MATGAFTPLIYTDRYFALETDENELVLVDVQDDSYSKQLFKGRDAVDFFSELSQIWPLLYCWRKTLLANPRWRGKDKWEEARTVSELDVRLGKAAYFCAAPSTLDLNDTTWRGGEDRPLRVRLIEAGFTVYEDPQRILLERLLAACDAFPAVAGFLSHPLTSDPAELWLRPAWADPGTVDTNYPHLYKLFSAFNLDPVDACALYCFFLGCFHPASLDHPRPILLIDSEMQGRGKGEIGTALTVLLDNKQSSVPISGGNDRVTTRIVSCLVDGSRTLAGQNVSGAADWNNEFIVCLATDGSVKERPLYGREAVPFDGIVGSLSAVYGQASFHYDVVDRAQRVFLRGQAKQLDPQPAVYVKKHRDAIIDEIMVAHSRAVGYTGVTHSRFNQFEAAAAPAYAEMSNLSHDAVSDLLLQVRRGARGLLTDAVRSLYLAHQVAFSRKPHKEVTTYTGIAIDSDALEGARALGYTFTNGEWTL